MLKEGMMHEVTEAYVGAKMSKAIGVSSGDSNAPNNFYKSAHDSATPQTTIIKQYWYDANGNRTDNHLQAQKVEWVVLYNNKEILVQKYP